jgi:hypothetical protein
VVTNSLLPAVAPPVAKLTPAKPSDYQPIINNQQNTALKYILDGGLEI